MAIWRVGEAAGLKWADEGLDMEEMYRLSFWRVGVVKVCVYDLRRVPGP